mmetsp:Transcript_13405/g.37079  ORF Transcript_13405/g.37079 Transcript_13405/m.37079 type:complete len:278 (+) Transcript_13405:132-965(+)
MLLESASTCVEWQMELMVLEGLYGTLSCFVITRTPPKVCHFVEHLIRPLSLHRPMRPEDTPEAAGPVSEIKITGGFSMAQMHGWVCSCFPGVPPKVPDEETARFNFESGLLGTRISAEYTKGEATFRGSNLSALAVVKDAIAREVSRLGIKLDVRAPNIDEKCVMHMLRAMHPRLERLMRLKERARYLDALAEIGAQEGGAEFLDAELRETSLNADQIRADHRESEKRIEFLEQTLEQFFIDRFKFRGINVKHRAGEAKELVKSYSWEGLVALFAAT